MVKCLLWREIASYQFFHNFFNKINRNLSIKNFTQRRERERERGTKRQTDKHRQTNIDKQADGQTDSEKERQSRLFWATFF